MHRNSFDNMNKVITASHSEAIKWREYTATNRHWRHLNRLNSHQNGNKRQISGLYVQLHKKLGHLGIGGFRSNAPNQ